MSLRIEIEDAKFGTRNSVGVTKRGQLIVAPLSFNVGYYQSLSVINTAYNFIVPVSGQQFIINQIIYSADKNVSSTNGAEIRVFEAEGVDSTTSTKDLLTLDVGRLQGTSIGPLNMITSEGVWINAVTDDATCNVTLLGYYVEVIT